MWVFLHQKQALSMPGRNLSNPITYFQITIERGPFYVSEVT